MVTAAWPRSLFDRKTIEDIDFNRWLNEAFAIGSVCRCVFACCRLLLVSISQRRRCSVENVYLNGTFQCGSKLTQKYVDATRDIAQQRIALAG